MMTNIMNGKINYEDKYNENQIEVLQKLLENATKVICERNIKIKSLSSKLTNVDKKLEKQCIAYQKALDETMSEKMDLEDIIKKSITEINIIIEIITEQPSKNMDVDAFILQKLKGVLYVLEGKWNNE